MPKSLPILVATRWNGFKGSGRTQPALIACDLPDGGEVECVVKLGGHKESSAHQPVCEAIAALLAIDLGLPVAEPMLVEITPEFATRAIPTSEATGRARCQKSLGRVFATRHLPVGFSTIPVNKPPARALLPALAELYAFDALIQNADRMSINPNCLMNGSDLRFFDHDQAFGFLLDIFGAPDVAKPESYAFLAKHFARPFLPRDRALFNRLEGAWEAISDLTLEEYRNALPDAWPGKKTYFPAIETHLKAVRAKLASTLDLVTMSLAPS
jgi:hypothetical protein